MQKKLTEHVPRGELAEPPYRDHIVGCGGTGSQIATGMPYLHQALLASGHPYGLRVFLIDGDRITETNCVRQPFSRSEVGLYKAVVLINRLNCSGASTGRQCRISFAAGRTCPTRTS